MTRARSGVAAAAALLALCGCAVRAPYVAPGLGADFRPAPTDSIDARLVLVGDAGKTLEQPNLVLGGVRREAALAPDRTVVVYLGDNAYPDGLPPEDAPDRGRAENVLRAQAAAGLDAGARVVFVPGNHDWAGDGWRGVQRQATFVEALDARVRALPRDACPGPDVLDLGAHLRLVVLDSQWWLQTGDKPRHPGSPCSCDSDGEIATGLERAIASAGDRRVVVAAHHPLATHGVHGGFFDWRQHVFPLRDAVSWLWIPLPVVGSVYPLARRLGIADQDLSDGKYERYRDTMHRVLGAHPVLAFVAGHEHVLQILDVPGTRAQAVSGSGSKVSRVGRGRDTRLAAGTPGFMTLTVHRSGRADLEVFAVDAAGPRRLASLQLAP